MLYKEEKISFNKYFEYYITISKINYEKEKIDKLLLKITNRKIIITKIIVFGNLSEINLINIKKYSEKWPIQILGNKNNKINENKIDIFILGFSNKPSLKKIHIKYIKKTEKKIGVIMFDNTHEYLLLTGLDSREKRFDKKIQEIYKIIKTELLKHGFSVNNIIRYWNFIENIDVNYNSFNLERNKFYDENSINDLPAATGIDAKINNNINICIEAIRGKEITTHSICSNLQCDPTNYEIRFSRARIVDYKRNKIRKIFISGTSSINKIGKSVFLENKIKNIEYTMECVNFLLTNNKFSYKNIATSVVYCKNEKIFNLFMNHYKKNKWKFPYCSLITDICREELIFEFECTAIKNNK